MGEGSAQQTRVLSCARSPRTDFATWRRQTRQGMGRAVASPSLTPSEGPAPRGMCSQSSRQPTSRQLADTAETTASRGPLTQVDSRAGSDEKFSAGNAPPASRVPPRTLDQHARLDEACAWGFSSAGYSLVCI